MASSRPGRGQDDVPEDGTVHADASPAGSLPAAASAWEALHRAHVGVMHRLQVAGPFGELSPVEADVLLVLARCPGQALRLVQLNRQVALAQPSLSRLVARLCARGLLERCPEPHDARGTVVRLTAEGAELQQRVGAAHLQAVHQTVGARLTDDELRQLGELAERLRAGAADG